MALRFTTNTFLATQHPIISKTLPFNRITPPLTTTRPDAFVLRAKRGLSSRKPEKRGGKGVVTEEQEVEGGGRGLVEEGAPLPPGFELSTTPMPVLPGKEKDFWEGPQWDGLGFLLEYLWAFGVVFALVACGVAVATYNEGATDFKQTPAYKEALQSQELLEEPEVTESNVFEGNPTEDAPSLE